MNKKTITFGAMALSLGAVLITPTVDAFWGGRGGEMSQEKFTEMKQMVNSYSTVEEFQEAMKTKNEEMRAEHEAMKNLVSHEVEKIDNGVIVTATTEDADALAKMKERHEEMGEREMKNENITQTVVELDNGFKTTITTDDEDTLSRLYERADNGWDEMGKGKHMGKMDGEMNGKRKGQGKERGFGKNNVEKE
jgi:hypothetical protein